MQLKLIACNVFMREACYAIARSPHIIDPVFTELGEHVRPEALRARLQAEIDAAETAARPYDAVLLLFGLCGNAGVGLQARTRPLVMPRAHDCCAILLGSRAVFREHFADDPSTPFSSAGYLERGEYFLRVEDGVSTVQIGDAYAAYVEQYGEENARYIMEAMAPKRTVEGPERAVFIYNPEITRPEHEARVREGAEAEGKQFVHLDGSLRLVEGLLNGDWDPADYLILQPGEVSQGVYDWEEIIRATAPQ
jgi:hypothetical protein